MILIRELSTAFSVEANTVSRSNCGIQLPARDGGDRQETAAGRHRRNQIAKVCIAQTGGPCMLRWHGDGLA
jgi:hypothetical protein